MERNPTNQYDALDGKIVQTRYKDDILLYKLYGPIGKVQNQPLLLPQPKNGQTTTVTHQPTQNRTTKVYQFPVSRVQNPNYNQQTTTKTYQTVYRQPEMVYKPQTVVYPPVRTVSTVYKEKEKDGRGWPWIIVPIALLFLLLAAFLLRNFGLFASAPKKLDTPDNLAVNGYALSWDKVNYASSYIVDIDGEQFETKNNGYSLAGLSVGEYSIKVKAAGSDTYGDSAWSDIYKYSAKQKISRPSNAFVSGGYLKWDIVPGAKYLIYINGNVYESDTNSFDLSSLGLPEGSYLVRILVRTPNGDSEWTEFYYNVQAKVPMPVNIRLSGTTLIWDKVADATGYSVNINGTTYSTDINGFQLQFLTPDSTYEVRVMAHIGSNSSEWTPAYIYTTAGALPVPSGLHISAGMLQWVPILNASGYIVEISGHWFYANSSVFSLFAATTPMLGTPGNYAIRVFAVGNDLSDSMWTNPLSHTVIKLPVPANVQLNNGNLTWIGSQDAVRYIVEMNGARYDAGLNSNYYVGTDPDLYNVRVMAEGNGWSVLDSDYSEMINHKIIKTDKPSGLQINDKLLTWNPVDSALGYAVEINDKIYNTEEPSFSLDSEELRFPNLYNIRVKALGNGDNILDSEWSDAKIHEVVAKLETPGSLTIEDGILSWTSPDGYSSKYTVSISGTQHPTTAQYFTLSDLALEPGTYEIRVMAKGNSMTLFDSDWSDAIIYTVIKLDTPENLEILSGGGGGGIVAFTLTSTTPTLTWTAVPNAKYYIVEVNEIPNTVETNAYSLGGFLPGVYNIRIKAVGDAPDFIESDWSTWIRYEVFKLNAPEDIALISDTVVMWKQVSNASGYKIEIDDYEVISLSNSFDLGTLGLQPGAYGIVVTTLGNNISHYTSEPSENVVPYTVFRLAVPQNLVITEGVLNWNNVTNASGYIVRINEKEYATSVNSYKFEELEENIYAIEVKATGNDITHYGSYWSEALSYTVEKLNIPLNLKITDGTMTWTPVGNALSYNIDIDGAPYSSTQSSLKVTFLQTAKTYNIKVQAVGNKTNFLNSPWSSEIQYTVTKLNAPALAISGTNATWSAVANANGYYIRINNGSPISVAGNSYSLAAYTSLGSHKVEVMTKGNGSDLIDSEWSGIKLYTVAKLTSPAASISGKTVSWGGISNASGYTVFVNNSAVSTQAGTSYTLTVTAVGTYNVQIRANGNSANYLNSDLSNTVSYKIVTPPRTDGCVVAGTLVTLADGSKKPVEQLNGSEMLLVWNFLTGQFDSAPVQFVKISDATINDMIQLQFSDGTNIKIARVHGFFDLTLNKFVYITKDNAAELKGHFFNKQTTDINGKLTWTKVQLINITVTTETVTVYNPVTYRHLSSYLNGMLTMPAGSEGIVNIFEVNAATMQYDMEKYYRDILTYGLFTYDDLAEYMPEVMFDALNGQYFKIAIAKGLLDMEKLPEIFTHFAASLELHTPIIH